MTLRPIGEILPSVMRGIATRAIAYHQRRADDISLPATDRYYAASQARSIREIAIANGFMEPSHDA